MALDQAQLSSDLEAFFASPPETVALCAQKWADVMEAYASDVEPPSTSVSTAATTLATDLEAAFQNETLETTAADMETAFAAFASTVGDGMEPDYTATPPPGDVGFEAQFSSGDADTHAQAASEISTLIDDWMKTGTADDGSGPINWS